MLRQRRRRWHETDRRTEGLIKTFSRERLVVVVVFVSLSSLCRLSDALLCELAQVNKETSLCNRSGKGALRRPVERQMQMQPGPVQPRNMRLGPEADSGPEREAGSQFRFLWGAFFLPAFSLSLSLGRSGRREFCALISARDKSKSFRRSRPSFVSSRATDDSRSLEGTDSYPFVGSVSLL